MKVNSMAGCAKRKNKCFLLIFVFLLWGIIFLLTKNNLAQADELQTVVRYGLSTPEGSIVINTGAAYTQERQISLSLAAVDDGFTQEELQMKISQDPELTDTSWQTYQNSVSYLLPDIQGAQQIYYQLLNPLGNTSGIYHDSIIFDNEAPMELELLEPSEGQYVNQVNFKWLQAQDSTSEVSNYVLSFTTRSDLDNVSVEFPGSLEDLYHTDEGIVEYQGQNTATTTDDFAYFRRDHIEEPSMIYQGQRDWSLSVVDAAGNETQEQISYFLDQAGPSISKLSLGGQTIQEEDLVLTNVKQPSFVVRAIDELVGEDGDYQAAAGVGKIFLQVKKQFFFGLYRNSAQAQIDVKDNFWTENGEKIMDNQLNLSNKYGKINLQVPQELAVGNYQIEFWAEDRVGNPGELYSFYLEISDELTTEPSPTPIISLVPDGEKQDVLEIEKEEKQEKEGKISTSSAQIVKIIKADEKPGFIRQFISLVLSWLQRLLKFLVNIFD